MTIDPNVLDPIPQSKVANLVTDLSGMVTATSTAKTQADLGVANAATAQAAAAAAQVTANAAGIPAAANWANWDSTRDRTISDVVSDSGIVTGYNFYPVMCTLDSTRAFIVYYDNTAGIPKVIVATIDATTNVVTYGTAYSAAIPITPTATIMCKIAKIATDKVLVFYSVSTTSVKAVVFTVSGTVITAGSPVTVNSQTTNQIDMCYLDTDKCVVVNTYAAAQVNYCTVLSVSGTTITVGTMVNDNVGAAMTGYVRVSRLSPTSFITANAVNTPGLRATAATVSGTTITLGSNVAVGNLGVTCDDRIELAGLSSTKAVLCGTDTNQSTYAAKLTISGTTITVASFGNIGGIGYAQNRAAVAASSTNMICIGSVPNYSATSMMVWNIAIDLASTILPQCLSAYTFGIGLPGSIQPNKFSIDVLSPSKLLAMYFTAGSLPLPKLRLIQL